MLGGASAGAFYDLYEDGTWDVLALQADGRLRAWRNSGVSGQYFLKATTTDGACASDAFAVVPGEEGTVTLPAAGENARAGWGGGGWGGGSGLNSSALAAVEASAVEASGGVGAAGRCAAQVVDRPFGVWLRQPSLHQPAVTYQFATSLPTRWSRVSVSSIWSWNRQKQSRVGVQLPQGGYSPLASPFLLVGLGLTNDYVEQLMVGMPAGRLRRFEQAVLPNSQLTVIPHPLDAPHGWEMQLYLEPRQQLAVALVCSALLLLLGAVIAVLEVVERVHDFRENKALRPALPL